MEPAKYVHGGEGTLVEDDVVVAVAAIVDDAERKGVLTWYARVACVSVSGGVVVIASIPGTTPRLARLRRRRHSANRRHPQRAADGRRRRPEQLKI
jgi:hypothetical protein